MSRLPDDCDCNQKVARITQQSRGMDEKRIMRTKSKQQLGFFHLPLEVRNIIYGYVFHGAILRIGKKGVDIEKSWGHCEILQSCRAVIEEAAPILFSTATQLFTAYWQDEAQRQVREKGLNLRPVHPQKVPSMQVVYSDPDKNVRLDMKALNSYKQLKLLDLGVFSYMLFEDAPYHVLKDDGETMNESNDAYVVTELKKTLVNKDQYKDMMHKPVTLQALQGILHSKTRNFKVLLQCEIDLIHFDGQGEYCEQKLVCF